MNLPTIATCANISNTSCLHHREASEKNEILRTLNQTIVIKTKEMNPCPSPVLALGKI
jgi:hypothetical protein